MLIFQYSATPSAAQQKSVFSQQQLSQAVQNAGARFFSTRGSMMGEGLEILLSKVVWGPNLESTYWFRTDYVSGLADTSPEGMASSMLLAAKKGIPITNGDAAAMERLSGNGIVGDSAKEKKSELAELKRFIFSHRREQVSPEEMLALFAVNRHAGLEVAEENGVLAVIKHFPGATDGSIGYTEKSAVDIDLNLQQLLNGPAAPFILAFNSRYNHPKAVMTAHVSYSAAENELRKKYDFPHMEFCAPVPATFSPYLIKGLLRQELGFDGLIVSDWMSMGAIYEFIDKIQKRLPAEIKGANYTVLQAICSIYAGINLITGVYVDDKETKELRRYYDSNKDFRLLLDELALESLFLRLKCMPKSKRPSFPHDMSGIKLSDLKNSKGVSLEKQKIIAELKKIIGLEGKEPLAFRRKLQSILLASPHKTLKNEAIWTELSQYSRSVDLWNRGGILALEFRKNIVEELTGKKFASFGRNDMYNPSGWLNKLFSEPGFRKTYESIDWNGKHMRLAFSEYAGKLQNNLPLDIVNKKGFFE